VSFYVVYTLLHQIIYEQHLEKSRLVRTIDVQATFDIDIPKNAFEFKK